MDFKEPLYVLLQRMLVLSHVLFTYGTKIKRNYLHLLSSLFYPNGEHNLRFRRKKITERFGNDVGEQRNA